MNLHPDKILRLLADATRLRALVLLLGEGRLCVCELSHALQVSQPKISRHLAQLRNSGLVIDERRGQWVHYRLADDLPDWIRDVITAVARAPGEQQPPWRLDSQRIHDMTNRPEAAAYSP